MATHLERPTASPVATGRTEAAPSRGGYLYQLDFVRTITFLLVVFIHTLTNTNDEVDGTVTNAIAMNLHFTRNAFFALTGFVLVYQYRDRKLDPIDFWRRRYKAVGLPFLTWSVFYWLYHMYVMWPPAFSNVTRTFETWESTKAALKVLERAVADVRAQIEETKETAQPKEKP